MKRLLAIVFALIMGLAWTLPSLAAVDFSGQYRVRYEYRDNADFNGKAVDSKGFWGQRIRLTTKASPTDDVHFKITVQDTRDWGELGQSEAAAGAKGGPTLTEVNFAGDTGTYVLDIHEGWLQIDNIFGSPLAVRIGRQELVYGDQRLVGAFGWSNNGRSFDALKLMYRSDAVDVDAWWSIIDDWYTHNDQDFLGVYATVKTVPDFVIDLYALLVNDGYTQAVANNSGALAPDLSCSAGGFAGVCVDGTRLWTYGFRVKGNVGPVDFTVEAPFQSGKVEITGARDYDIDANAYVIDLGFNIPGAPMAARVGAQYVYASGDSNAADRDLETFFNLYPTNHLHYGFADQQGWRNVKAWNLNATAKVTPKTTVRLDYWDFSLDEKADCWYGAGNWMNSGCGAAGSVRSANTLWDDELGSEIDITVKHKYNDNVAFQFGYSRFNTGNRIDDWAAAAPTTRSADDLDWAYFQVVGNYGGK